MRNYRGFIWVSVVCGLLFSCSSSKKYQSLSLSEDHRPVSKYYTSSFPNRDVTEKLKEAQQSVVRIIATGFYNSYNFEGKYVTLADLETNGAKELSTTRYSSEENTAGTSIILDRSSRNFLLITCEHVVSFPDTAITYYEGENMPTDTYIKSISIKKRQNNLLFTGSELQPFEVISTNKRLDLALLDVKLNRSSNLDLYPLDVNVGDSNFLRLGSFLYILGFPKGYAMVTRGLASSSESWNDRFFITDASFNRGISGGLVLATNDNFRSFKWVGMASSSDATRENVLVPRPNTESSPAARPYLDSVFVQRKTRINYGITQSIPINSIKDFLRDNERTINRHGFQLRSVFSSK